MSTFLVLLVTLVKTGVQEDLSKQGHWMPASFPYGDNGDRPV